RSTVAAAAPVKRAPSNNALCRIDSALRSNQPSRDIEHLGAGFGQRRVELRPGRAAMSAAAEGLADSGGVVWVTCAHADLDRVGAVLFEENRHLHAVDALQRVDDAFSLLHVGTRLVEHQLGDL